MIRILFFILLVYFIQKIFRLLLFQSKSKNNNFQKRKKYPENEKDITEKVKILD